MVTRKQYTKEFKLDAIRKEILSEARNFIDFSDKRVVVGLVEGRTIQIRCDVEGVAFFVIAWRHRPDEETQFKTSETLVKAFDDSEQSAAQSDQHQYRLEKCFTALETKNDELITQFCK